MNYTETLDYLYRSQPVFHLVGGAAYKPGLHNTIQLLSALGNPHERFQSVHIAGTNGKGSTSHIIAAVLQASGLKVGLYTSPHLVHFGERIRLNGAMVPEQFVVNFVSKHQQLLEQIRPSFFETTMCMAFSYFAEQQVDIAVVEVGLGGRLDSTNILQPRLSVITNIGLDHTEFLGNTLHQVAKEKGGIIKPHTPVVIGETHPETAPIFLRLAAQCQAPICFADQVADRFDTLHTTCELGGSYQVKNQQTAYTALLQLQTQGFPITNKSLHKGFSQVCTLTGLQGRWQTLREKPRVICDTGHNAHGIAYVVEQLMQQECRTLRMVLGMVRDKDISEVLALLPQQATYYFTQSQTPRALLAEEFLAQAAQVGLQGKAYPTVMAAYRAALRASDTDDVVFVGGSNFVVGELLGEFSRL